jgi:uncharacterized protein (DUF1684 family)
MNKDLVTPKNTVIFKCIHMKYLFQKLLKYLNKTIFCMILIFSGSCTNNPETQVDDFEIYQSEIDSWKDGRISSLKKNWLSLAGLFKLKEGENSFGASETNDIVFPDRNVPDHMGSFFMNNGMVRIKINSDVEVLHNNESVREMEMQHDQSGNPTVLNYGTFSWHIIKRVNKMYVRLRDSKNPQIYAFKGITSYPLDTNWRFHCEFEPHMTTKIIETTTTSGDPSRISSSGAVGFRINGQYFRLDVWSIGNSGRFQTIFADETSGIDTYGAGRFIIVEKSNKSGNYMIDFNKSYNPPCAFTEFTTCPLPPPQNRLPIKITAGEKKYKDTGQ